MRLQSRVPEIVADAAYAILAQPSRQYTGNHCIDEHVLGYQGVRDFGRYATTPGSTELTEDGYVEADYVTKRTPKQVLRPLPAMSRL